MSPQNFIPKSSPKNQGSARWASQSELNKNGLFSDDGLIIGRYLSLDSNPLIGIAKTIFFQAPLIKCFPKGHVLTFAGTRAGKGVSSVIPNLLHYKGSTVVNDPKGENFAVTARARNQMGQKIYLLDPFDVCNSKLKSTLNPLDFIDPKNTSLVDDAKLLSDMIVLRTGQEKDPYWDDKARSVIAGFILYIACHAPQSKRNLSLLRRIIMAPVDKFEEVLSIMLNSPLAYGVIANTANAILRMNPTELNSVMSTIERHTEFLDSPTICSALTASSINLRELKNGRTSLYLVFPPDKISIYSRLLRIWLASALLTLVRDQRKPQYPILFMLDEMANLGRMEILSSGVSYFAGHGISLWMILQDLSQLMCLYPNDEWRTFIANSSIKQFFGIRDKDTAEYISQTVGQTSIDIKSKSKSYSIKSPFDIGWKFPEQTNITFSQASRPLIMPDEVLNLSSNIQLLFVDGIRPFPSQRVLYYQDSEFSGLFDKNPMY
jgi:type IV secretion system protein VirD4